MITSDRDARLPSSASDSTNPAVTGRKEDENLIQNPDFHLIKVKLRKGARINRWRQEIESMTVVTPALDPKIAREVKEFGWSCLSHLWGDPSTWVNWDDSGVVDGRTGALIGAKLHPSKRAEIITLLQSMGGFWWIDVFCAQTDTPLVIMGDIYRHSKHCYALIDSSPAVFYSKKLDPLATATAAMSPKIDEAASHYVHALSDTADTLVTKAGWKTLLGNLLQWSVDHFHEIKERDLLRMRRYIANDPIMKRLSESVEACKNHPDTYDGRSQLHAVFMAQQMEGWEVNDLIQSIEITAGFLECQWMNRAWTLQELALPCKVAVPPPYLTQDEDPDQIPANVYNLQRTLARSLRIIMNAYHIQLNANDYYDGHPLLEVFQSPRHILNSYRDLDPTLACIYSDYRKLLEVVLAIGLRYRSKDETKVIGRDRMRRLYLNAFATSQRKASYSADYVYSVLGILDIDIPRLDDLEEIWRRFATELQKRYPDIGVPFNVDLAGATKMEDVYGNFKFRAENQILSNVDINCFIANH